MAEPQRKIAGPAVTPETQPFWDAAAAGRLLIKQCEACGERHHYPRPICPFCGSEDTVLESSFGPTLCRSTHFCPACRNPFEAFKPKGAG